VNAEPRPVDEILRALDAMQREDPDVHGNRLFGLVYPSGREDIETLIRDVYERFLFTNALNPLKFAALATMEREVISMAGDLVHRVPTEHHGGSMTSGGTESILMSMLVNAPEPRASIVPRFWRPPRRIPPTPRPRTTSTWTTYAFHSTVPIGPTRARRGH